jgi:hypothetical protein
MASCIVPKCYHIMDVHMKTWTGYGKTRLSTVSFSSDPVPAQDTATMMDIDILRNCSNEATTDYVIIPHQGSQDSQDSQDSQCMQCVDDVWTFIAIE